MVQRKFPNKKLGIPSNDFKFEKQKRLENGKKPSSCHQLDGKSRGPDLKKKMKKSRSIKFSDMEGLRSSPLNKTMAQPGKPPPLHVVTPKKQALIKTVGGSPNYMKSTSSSEAKKESSQVSSWDPHGKNLCQRNSTTPQLSSVSSNKSARTLAKTCSFKLVRSLTKTPSFKPIRPSAKKCSRVVLYADMNAQRATCSSTLKDLKFPPYIMLNPGATESEGTSVMKVCSYTYCSLNGHHHTPVQPLKCFLSARRRSLKIQRSMKLEALSPRRAKPFVDGKEEIGIEQFSDEKPALSPWGGGGMDIFIKIYAKNKGDVAEANEGTTQKDLESTTESEENKFSLGGTDGGALGEDGKQVSENLSEGSPHSEIDFDEINSEMKNDADDYSLSILVGEASATGSLRNGYDSEGECHPHIETDDNFAMSMEWDEEQFPASEFDYEGHYSMGIDDEFHFSIQGLLEKPDISLDDSVNNPSKKILVDGVEQEDCEEDSSHTDYFSQVSCALDYDQYSTIEDVFDASATMEEKETQEDLIGIMTISDLTKVHLLEEEVQENGVIETDNMLPEATQNNGATEDTDEALNKTENIQLHSFNETEQDEINEDYNGIQKPEDYNLSPAEELPSAKDGAGMEEEAAGAELFAENQMSDSSQNFSGADKIDDEVDNNQYNQKTERYLIQNTADESHSTGRQDRLLDGQGQHKSKNVVGSKGFLEEGQDRTRGCKIPSSMESDKEKNSMMHKSHSAEESTKPEKMEVEGNNGSDVAEIFGTASDISSQESESTISLTGSKMSQELPVTCNSRKWKIFYNRQHENFGRQSEFNPREPNFLPLVSEPDAEKVDLKHQMIDERKNSEEWMLDYALRQVVTRLAPARKRKVALLVEAFETVALPPFAHGGPIQACG